MSQKFDSFDMQSKNIVQWKMIHWQENPIPSCHQWTFIILDRLHIKKKEDIFSAHWNNDLYLEFACLLCWLVFSEPRQPFRAVYIDRIPILNRPSSPEREHSEWNDKIASAWRECEARKLVRHLRDTTTLGWISRDRPSV